VVPDAAQVDAADRYTLGLAAQDESHAPVPHDYVIVLRGAGRPDCPGTPPQIVSTSPPPPDTVSTSLDYRVDAVVTDAQGLKDAPLLYWSTDPPADPARPDVTAFRQALFVSDGADNYHAAIPNLSLADGERRTIYYVVSATDNDDPEGSGCDPSHRLGPAPVRRHPRLGHRVRRVLRCVQRQRAVRVECVRGRRVPFLRRRLRACPAGGECRSVTTVEGAVQDACVPPALDCRGGGSCTDDGHEDNDTRADARSSTSTSSPV